MGLPRQLCNSTIVFKILSWTPLHPLLVTVGVTETEAATGMGEVTGTEKGKALPLSYQPARKATPPVLTGPLPALQV